MSKPKQHECPQPGGGIIYIEEDMEIACGYQGNRCHACREDAMERRHKEMLCAIDDISITIQATGVGEQERHKTREDRADARAILAEYSFNRPEAKLDDIIMTLTGIQQALRGGGKEGDDE